MFLAAPGNKPFFKINFTFIFLSLNFFFIYLLRLYARFEVFIIIISFGKIDHEQIFIKKSSK